MRRNQLLKSGLLVAGFTAISKVTGMLRDVFLARAFGSSALVDAFFVALKIPNFFRRTLGEGALVNAFVPVYTSLSNENIDERRSLLAQVSFTLSVFTLFLCSLFMIFAPTVILFFAPGFAGNELQLQTASVMLRLTMPYLLFMSLAAMAVGVLNVHGRFALGAFTPTLFNFCIIISVIYFQDVFSIPLYAACIAVSISGVLQWIILRHSLRRYGYVLQFKIPRSFGHARKVFRLMLPSILSSSAYQVNALIDTIIASFLISGSITWLYYGERMMQVPLGTFAVAIGIVVLPVLAKSFIEVNKDDYYKTLAWGVRMVLLLALPSTLGLAILAEPIMYTLFNYGEFNDTDVKMSALALMAYSFGLPALMLIKVYTSAWFAKHDSRKPMIAGLYAVGIHLVLSLVLAIVIIIYNIKIIWLHVILALGTSVGAIVHCYFLRSWLLASDREYFATHSDGWDIFKKICIATFVMSIVVIWAKHYFLSQSVEAINRIISLLLLLATGALSFFVTLKIVGLDVKAIINKESIT